MTCLQELQTSSSRPNGHIPVNKPDYKTVTRQDPKPVGKPDNKSTFKADFKTEIKKPYQSYHDDSDDVSLIFNLMNLNMSRRHKKNCFFKMLNQARSGHDAVFYLWPLQSEDLWV